VQDQPLDLESLHLTSELPRVHRDPFDRLLVAQSQTHRLKLVSPDQVFPDYGIDVLW
jgi:PIN domain nuclease of toxin-antitoxin system